MVLDYSMHEMNGGAIARAMKANRPLTPIILVSGLAIEKDDLPEVDGVVTKGAGPALLLEKITSCLRPPERFVGSRHFRRQRR